MGSNHLHTHCIHSSSQDWKAEWASYHALPSGQPPNRARDSLHERSSPSKTTPGVLCGLLTLLAYTSGVWSTGQPLHPHTQYLMLINECFNNAEPRVPALPFKSSEMLCNHLGKIPSLQGAISWKLLFGSPLKDGLQLLPIFWFTLRRHSRLWMEVFVSLSFDMLPWGPSVSSWHNGNWMHPPLPDALFRSCETCRRPVLLVFPWALPSRSHSSLHVCPANLPISQACFLQLRLALSPPYSALFGFIFLSFSHMLLADSKTEHHLQTSPVSLWLSHF